MPQRTSPAHLSPEQRAFFEEHGYLLVKGALNPAQVARFTRVADETIDRQREAEGLGEGEHVQARNAIHKNHELLDLLDWPATFPLVAELMGPALQLNTSHVLYRPPQPKDTAGTYKAIDWHRDGCREVMAVNGQYPWIYTKIGYFLTDLSAPDRGNLRVVPGSHRDANPLKRGANGDPEGAIQILSEPGDAVLFQQRLWHAVGPNFAAHARKNIYMGYCFRWLKPIDYLLPDPALLAKATPVQRQLLGEMRSECSFWLPKEDEVPLRDWLKEHQAAAV